MDPYCQYDNAFSNKENDDLDKMARKINNQRKTSNKILTKQVLGDMNKKKKETCVGINCLMEPSNARFAPSNLASNFSFFSTQGDFASRLPSPLEKKLLESDKMDVSSEQMSIGSLDTKYLFDKNSSKSSEESTDIISNLSNDDNFSDMTDGKYIEQFSDSESMYSLKSISSNYSLLPEKVKKNMKSSTHLKDYKDDDKASKHINKCNKCRAHLLHLLHQDNHVFPISTELNNVDDAQNKEGILSIGTLELRDILILILIGIFIIIIIDMVVRR